MNLYYDIFNEENPEQWQELNKDLEKGIPSTSTIDDQRDGFFPFQEANQGDPVVQIEEMSHDLWSNPEQDDLVDLVDKIFQINPESNNIVSKTKIIQKNSNVVKKTGRILLDNIDSFRHEGQLNQGVTAMLGLLDQKKKEKKNMKDKRDGFNTTHLKALFNQCSEEVSSHNLRVAREILNLKLRRQVLKSCQIKKSNKVLYLSTLKCAALRCCNKQLALRLQLSESSSPKS